MKLKLKVIIILTLLASLFSCMSSDNSASVDCYNVHSYIDSSNCIHFHCNIKRSQNDNPTKLKSKFVAEVKVDSDEKISVVNKQDHGYIVGAWYANSIEYVEYKKYVIYSNDGSGWKLWKTVDYQYDFSSLFSLKNTDSSFETLTKEMICKHFGFDENNAYTINIIHPIANNMLYNNYALVDVSISENGLLYDVTRFAKYIDNTWMFIKIGYFGYMKYNIEEDSFTFEEFTEPYKKIISAIGFYNYNNNDYNYNNNYFYNYDHFDNGHFNNIIRDDGTVHRIDYDWDANAVYYEVYDPTSETPEVPIRRELIEKPEGYNF